VPGNGPEHARNERIRSTSPRRKKAGVPKAITFKTKPEIALEQIRKAYAAGVPRGAVLTDASYGSNSALRTGISALGLAYVAAIIPTVKVRRVSDRGASDERLSAKECWHSVCRNMLGARLPGGRERTIRMSASLRKRLNCCVAAKCREVPAAD
jgi:SRSO17 transposase